MWIIIYDDADQGDHHAGHSDAVHGGADDDADDHVNTEHDDCDHHMMIIMQIISYIMILNQVPGIL